MTMDIKEKARKRIRRHRRVRKTVSGTPQRPRLSVFRSQRHIYAQIIDDLSGRTLVSASSLDEGLKGKLKTGADGKAAHQVGLLIGRRALDQKLLAVVFDRGGYAYHGRVKALADGAREAGLSF